ncbi:VCBS repeat-containing protein [Mucilaginibacter yixingensis]|uniref:VCBS repeat-containing protein n=1 Tax=Mucilaginibacter yixingensis TaxID=1295612 RepID=A0A2T5JG20_9SPHI|nr:hypothetical protein [Mucilaginibacter yixingensis]PTR01380.1 VCBS repeat-containing protein [Mucilaginibacter yixingensis]
MINPKQFTYIQGDGSVRKVIAAPLTEASNEQETRTFKLYKDALDDGTTLFTDDSMPAVNDDISDDENPDYLGSISINQAGEWQYEGDMLNQDEQQQIAENLLTEE